LKRISKPNSVVERLAVLGDPIRLRLLRLLERQELSVGELSRVVQLPQSTVSRHLRLLAEGHWLIARAEGTSTLYRLVMDDLTSECRALWVTIREQLGDGPELAEDLRRLEGVLADRRLETREFFGRLAGEWDSVRNELFGDRVTLLSMLGLIPRDWVVADLGCGTGNAAEILAPYVRRVLAVDQSEPMLEAARKRLAGHTNVDFLKGDLERLPIDSNSVDAAACVLVLHHIAEPEQACREIARILRPGGTAIIVDMIEHDRTAYRHTMGHRWLGFGVPAMIRMMTSAGLEGVRFQTLPAESQAKGPGLFVCTATKSADITPDGPQPPSTHPSRNT
jgi:SAM-dependent methyltransferase/DNA-binding HxlR family transcriptional regulator